MSFDAALGRVSDRVQFPGSGLERAAAPYLDEKDQLYFGGSEIECCAAGRKLSLNQHRSTAAFCPILVRGVAVKSLARGSWLR
jgi:hypothetical protein